MTWPVVTYYYSQTHTRTHSRTSIIQIHQTSLAHTRRYKLASELDGHEQQRQIAARLLVPGLLLVEHMPRERNQLRVVCAVFRDRGHVETGLRGVGKRNWVLGNLAVLCIHVDVHCHDKCIRGRQEMGKKVRGSHPRSAYNHATLSTSPFIVPPTLWLSSYRQAPDWLTGTPISNGERRKRSGRRFFLRPFLLSFYRSARATLKYGDCLHL